jgi:hypothetical protein
VKEETMNEQTTQTGVMSAQDFLALGVKDIAYLRPIEAPEGTLFAICTADGNQVATMAEREVALATIRQNGLEPVSLH